MNYKKIWIGIGVGLITTAVLIGLLNLVLLAFNKYLTTQIFHAALLFCVGINTLITHFFLKKQKEIGNGILVASMLITLYWVSIYLINGE